MRNGSDVKSIFTLRISHDCVNYMARGIHLYSTKVCCRSSYISSQLVVAEPTVINMLQSGPGATFGGGPPTNLPSPKKSQRLLRVDRSCL